MKLETLGLTAATLYFMALLVDAYCAQDLLGFSAASAEKEAGIERIFKTVPAPAEARRQHRIFTAEPHPAGSGRNNELARYLAREWKKQGLTDIVLRRYEVFSSDPKMDRHVSVRGSDRVGDLCAQRQSGRLCAAAQERHRRQRQDRAGALFESVQLSRLQGNDGAAGGGSGDPHLRGAIEYDFQQAGDPTTPSWPSLPGAKHIPAAGALPVPKIMALPLSWHDARPLLEYMDGPVAPEDWQGGLPFKYHLGGDRVRAHLKIQMEDTIKANYVVEGRIRGSKYPDEWVLAGNHRDAWVFGAADPGSGTASMLEMTRGLGRLAKQGIRPKRTLVFISWDGEETSFAGSAEWSEQFAHELRQKAVAYLNVDLATTGADFHGSSVGSLAPLMVDASKSVRDPSGRSLYEAWQASRAKELNERNENEAVSDFNTTSRATGPTFAPIWRR